ncbi:MAG: YdgA family protein [Symbiopectobacterium sp.]
MKKFLVAVGVIIALGALWAGASWYTGKQLAQNIDTVTIEFNKQLQEAYPNSGFKLVYRDYQGGVFSSTFSLVLQPNGSASETRPLAPKHEIVLNETFSHGSLPLALLKKMNLRPSMAHIRSELANSEATKELFDVLQNQLFFSAETRVAFNGDTVSVISL